MDLRIGMYVRFEGKIHLTGHERYSFIYIKDIETIVTKDQFNDIAYKMNG